MQRRLYGERQTARQSGQPHPLPWLGKRLLLLAIASGSAGYAFHLFGTWALGVVAIVTPILGWAALVLAMQRQFGASNCMPVAFPENNASARAMAQMEADLAAQMDWRRRFGT